METAQRAQEHQQQEETQEQRTGGIARSEPQGTTAGAPGGGNPKSVPGKENRTGLPDKLKSGIENLSGYAMDDVKVHYNSDKPAQLQAQAYAQGTNIHLGPGQEKHLPHEAWHAVQQKQGRVQPTMQMKGKNINDDSGLEKEADVMGTRALQTHLSRRGAFKRPVQDHGAIQLKGDSKTSPSLQDAIKEESFEGIAAKNLMWEEEIRDLYDAIKDLKEQLEDDEDVKLLEKFEKEVDELHEEGEELTRQFNIAKYDPGKRISRSAVKAAGNAALKRKSSESSGGTPSKKARKNNAVSEEEYCKLDRAKEIEKLYKTIAKKSRKLKEMFPASAGGFSALGRAHKINTDILKPGDAIPEGKKKDNTFFEGITLSGEVLSNKHNVAKESLKVNEKASSPIVQGRTLPKKNNHLLEDLEKNLLKVKTPQKASYNKTPVALDRGAGQYANMGKTNATGYAWMTIPDWKTTRWEWLHVRAASLGGKTDGSNLVVGTRDCNTHMIPFESNLKSLAKIAHESDNYKKVEVEFKVNGEDPEAEHKFETIQMDWELVKEAGKPVEGLKGEAKFSPLKIGHNISKTEVTALEDALKEARADA